MRLHLAYAPDGTPRAAILAPADQKERGVALRLLPIPLRGGEALVCDRLGGAVILSRLLPTASVPRVLRPSPADEPDNGLHLSSTASSSSPS